MAFSVDILMPRQRFGTAADLEGGTADCGGSVFPGF
jgi:hypothetical protein